MTVTDLLQLSILASFRWYGCNYTRKNAQVVTNLQQICSNAVPTTCQQDVFALLVPSLLTSCQRLVRNLLQDCWAEQTCYKLFQQLGGVTSPPPPKNSKKRGPNLRRGGPGMLELRNVLNIKEFSGKLRSKKLNLRPPYVKLVFENFLDVCFWKQNVDLPSPFF
jgi:hypothetical protein